MGRYALTAAALIVSTPAFAASKNPFSPDFWTLSNTDLIVLIAFIAFIGVLVYFNVPGMITKMLDDRAAGIQSDIDEARALREEAQSLLASYERKQREVQEQADHIVRQAKADAEAAADKAREDLSTAVTRRLLAAEEQIASAEASAVKEVRDTAAVLAVQVAQDVIAKQMTATDANKLIDAAIAEVDGKLH